MRIIAGKYRGRTLETPKDYAIRPTSDMTREALFNILQTRIVDARVLDLFAGTGAVGVESLSRGAAHVTACDQSRTAVELVRRNMQKVGETPTIIQGDWRDCILRLVGKTFDVIYLDPPYAMEVAPILEALADAALCAEDGVVVYENDAKDPVPEVARWQMTKQRRYGRAMLTFWCPMQE